MAQSILIIDDEADIRDILSDIFTDEGYIVHKAAHSEQALSIIAKHKIDLIVLDIWLDNSDMDGVQILKHMKSGVNKNIPILMISGHGNVEMAVNAMKMGAFDFIEKPFKIDHILLTANRALEQKSLKEENIRLKENEGEVGEVNHDYQSPAMIKLMKTIQDNAESDARVVISGEVGSGKSYIARIIHDISKRSKNNMFVYHCHDFERDQMLKDLNVDPYSTILLENLELLSPDNQNLLLSILNKNDLNCRFISTSGPLIKDAVASGEFSSALYDRLSVLKYKVPNLNKRKEDILSLSRDFIEIFAKEFHIDAPNTSPVSLEKLKAYDWKGNIRQLKIVIEWAMMEYYINPSQGLQFDNLFIGRQNDEDNVVPLNSAQLNCNIYNLPLKQAREEFEKDYLQTVLQKYDGNIAKVAEFIDMERTALYRKLKSLNITYGDDVIAKANQS